ncbi:MAG: FMN-binding protein [Gemmatimonadota bacterium]|jgi:electron transport complex protein RnfG
MSDEIRKDGMAPDPGGKDEKELPYQDEVTPRDHELYTPQGGGSGTGAGPIQEVAVVGGAAAATSRGDSEGVSLPLVGPDVATAEALGLTVQDGGAAEASGGVPERPDVSSFRLLMTLGVAGMIAGALLVFVYLWSEPLIQAERARVLREAVTEVLKGPERFESVFLVDGELTAQVPADVDTMDLDKVFLGFDAAGNPMGFAMTHEGFGFQDLVTVIFGYDAQNRQVLGMKVLDHAETPGLGNKIEEEPFVGEFNGVDAPIEGVKPDRNTGAPNQVDMITGVTISSRAVIRIINERIAALGDLLAAYEIPAGTAGGGGDR